MEYPIEGIKVEELDENEEHRQFILNQHAYKCGFVRLMPYNQVLPKTYIKFAKRIHGFHVHQDDVWISSFPKCGNNFSGLFGGTACVYLVSIACTFTPLYFCIRITIRFMDVTP